MLPLTKLDSRIYNVNGGNADVALELRCTECGFTLASYDSGLLYNGVKQTLALAESTITRAETNPLGFFRPAHGFLHTCQKLLNSEYRGDVEVCFYAQVSAHSDPYSQRLVDEPFFFSVRRGATKYTRKIDRNSSFPDFQNVIDRPLFEELKERSSHQNLPLHGRAPFPEMVLGATDADDWNTVPVQEIRVHGAVVGFLYPDPSNFLNCVSYVAGS